MSQSAIQVSPGTDIRIAISPTIITADNLTKRFDPVDRQCYFENEFHFQYLSDVSHYYVPKPYFGGPGGAPPPPPTPVTHARLFLRPPPRLFFNPPLRFFLKGGGEAKSLGFLRGYETLKSQG